MNNYNERTWALVTMTGAMKPLVKCYVQYPPRKLQRMLRDQWGKEGITQPMPTCNQEPV